MGEASFMATTYAIGGGGATLARGRLVARMERSAMRERRSRIALRSIRATDLSRGVRLLRRLQQMRGARAQLVQQHRLIGLGGGEVAGLDVAEAADFFRDGGDADGQVMVVGIELVQE